jgi:hypothetical protein
MQADYFLTKEDHDRSRGSAIVACYGQNVLARFSKPRTTDFLVTAENEYSTQAGCSKII